MSQQLKQSITDQFLLEKSVYENTSQQGGIFEISDSVYEGELNQQKKQQEVNRPSQPQKVAKQKEQKEQAQLRISKMIPQKYNRKTIPRQNDSENQYQLIERYRQQIQSNQANISTLKRQSIEMSSKIQKLKHEMKKQYEEFQRQLDSIREDKVKLLKERQQLINKLKEASQPSSQLQKMTVDKLMNQQQTFHETQSNQIRELENQKLDHLFFLESSIKELQQKWSKQMKVHFYSSNNKDEKIVQLQKYLLDFQLQQKSLKSELQNIKHQKKLISDIGIQKDKTLYQKIDEMRVLAVQVHQLKHIYNNKQLKFQEILRKNHESNEISILQLKADQTKLHQMILYITSEKFQLADQLLEIKAELYDKIQQNTRLNRIVKQNQKIIQSLSAELREKKQKIQAIESSHEQNIFQYNNFINQLTNIFEEKYRNAIIQNQQFVSQLIKGKQTNYQALTSILQSQLTLSQFSNKKQIKNEQNLLNSIKDATQRYEKDILITKQQQKQLLQLSQYQCMQLRRQIQLNNKQINQIKLQQQGLKSQIERYRQVFHVITHHNSLNELIDQLQNINTNKVLDGVIFTFTHLQNSIQTFDLSNKDLSSKLNRQNAEIVKLNKDNEEKQITIQKLTDELYEVQQEKENLLNTNLKSLQEKDKQIQRINNQLLLAQMAYEQKVTEVNVLIESNKYLSVEIAQLKSIQNNSNELQTKSRGKQIAKYLATIDELNDKIKELGQKIVQFSIQNRKEKANSQILSQNKLKLIQQNQDLRQQIKILSSTQRQDKEMINLKQQNQQLKRQIQQLAQKKQVDLADSYQQLYENQKQQKHLFEAQLENVKAKYEKLKNSKQQVKQPQQTKQQVKKIETVVASSNKFFMMSSLIQTHAHGKQFLISVIQQYCQSRVNYVLMIFKMDDNNKTNFQNTFKPTDISQGIFLHLFMKKANIFGFITFHSKIKGSPSCIMFSVNNRTCVFRDEQKYETSAFKYEYNTLYFGNGEAKFKSGFKNFTASDTVLRKYFAKYPRALIFGEDFKEVLEINQFEIHKIVL